MLRLGVIDRGMSGVVPDAFASPLLIIKKPDGSNRVCLDFRELNMVTRFDAEPIPDPEVLFVSLRDQRYFSKIDLTKGYWQIPIAAEDREKTTFQGTTGTFSVRSHALWDVDCT